MGNYKRCPLCNEKIVKGRENMIAHIQKEHEDEIPMGQKAGEFLYLTEHNGEPRKCMICRKPTKWNEGSHKYNAFCSEKCKNEYVKLARARNKKVYGKENLLDDPEQQKKMLAHRSISGKYRHSDGGVLTYTGSYEEDFCEMMDNFLNFPSDDIIMPSPHVYEYNYRGEKKFYFPDAFIPSLSLEIEIKDGGDNPNMHHKIQDVDKVKEHLKDQVMFHQQDFHYIKIENKNYDAFFKLVEKLSEDHLTEMERLRKIKIVPESPTPIYEQVLTETSYSGREPDLDAIQYIYAPHGPGEKEVPNSILEYNGKKYRVRVETLIYNDQGMLYIGKRSDTPNKDGVYYDIPGGSVEPGKTLEDQAKAESMEEVRAVIDNVKYSGKWYTTEYDPNRLSKWKKEHLWPLGLKYDGAITFIFVGHYKKEYTGYIKKADRDDMVERMDWEYAEDIPDFREIHNDAIRAYNSKLIM